MAVGGSARKTALEKAVSGLRGGRETFDFAFGGDDVYAIVDIPDNESVAALALTVSGSGAVRVRTVVLLTPDRPDRAAQLHPDYTRPAGPAERHSSGRPPQPAQPSGDKRTCDDQGWQGTLDRRPPCTWVRAFLTATAASYRRVAATGGDATGDVVRVHSCSVASCDMSGFSLTRCVAAGGSYDASNSSHSARRRSGWPSH
jgi:uncharacterized protein with GYD domain